jgi:hypothetical protein
MSHHHTYIVNALTSAEVTEQVPIHTNISLQKGMETPISLSKKEWKHQYISKRDQ